MLGWLDEGLGGGEFFYAGVSLSNLAGPVNKREKFLRKLATSAVFTKTPLAEAIKKGYIKGMAVNLNRFVGWVDKSKYNDLFGYTYSTLNNYGYINEEIVKKYLRELQPYYSAANGWEVVITRATTDASALGFVLHCLVLERLRTDFTVLGYTLSSDGVYYDVRIQRGAQPEETHRIARNKVIHGALYVEYFFENRDLRTTGGNLPTVDVTFVPDYGVAPSWNYVNSIISTKTIDQRMEYQETFTDLVTGAETITPKRFGGYRAVSVQEFRISYIEALGVDLPNEKANVTNKYTIGNTYEFTGAEATEVVVFDGFYQGKPHKVTRTIFTKKKVEKVFRGGTTEKVTQQRASPLAAFFYEKGSDPRKADLDTMYPPADIPKERFYPPIPIRLDNKWIGDGSDEILPEVYKQNKIAFRKLFGGKLYDFLENLGRVPDGASPEEKEKIEKNNPDLGEMDYAYLTLGAAINSKDQSVIRYLYKFFENIWIDDTKADTESFYYEWAYKIYRGHIDYKIRAPKYWEIPSAPITTINTNSNEPFNYHNTIRWRGIKKVTGTGKLNVFGLRPAKVGEFWSDCTTEPQVILGNRSQSTKQNGGNGSIPTYSTYHYIYTESWDTVHYYFQETNDSWSRISVRGLDGGSQVYNDTPAKQKPSDFFESKPHNTGNTGGVGNKDVEGFLIPLYSEILKNMSIVDRTQLLTCAGNIEVHAYKREYIPFYKTEIFFFAIAIAVAIATAGSSIAASTSIGTTLGFTGATATVVGAAVLAGASYVVGSVIMKITVAVFGEKWGVVIGAIITAIVMNMGMQIGTGQSVAVSYGNLMRADNLLKLTSSFADSINKYAQEAMAQLSSKANESATIYKQDMAKIQDIATTLDLDSVGFQGNVEILKSTLLQKTSNESLDSYLERTLMTGSDIAGMSFHMIENMSNILLTLPKAIG